jgi:PII-like signaling protein
MLERFEKAHNKDAFDNIDMSNKLPVSIELINTYLKILNSAYLVNVYFERDSFTIAEIIPAVLKLKHDWD